VIGGCRWSVIEGRVREERGKKGVYISDTVGFPSGNVPRIYQASLDDHFFRVQPPIFSPRFTAELFF